MRPLLRHVAVPSLVGLLLVAGASPASAAPENDMFVNATEISGVSGTVTGSNVLASKEVGEPDHAHVEGGKSIWYRWTAPNDGPARFETRGSDIDTLLAVYTGPAVDSLSVVASNDDRSLRDRTSVVNFDAVAGTEYSIAIDSFDPDKMGDLRLTWWIRPPNDDFSDAETLAGGEGITETNNRLATREPEEPRHLGRCCRGDHSVWYTWTAPERGTLTLETRGSRFDTIMAVYKGSALSELEKLAQNDDGGRRGTSKIILSVRAGRIRHIAVASFGRSEWGRLVLRWSFVPRS
jgi:hypothetical protein